MQVQSADTTSELSIPHASWPHLVSCLPAVAGDGISRDGSGGDGALHAQRPFFLPKAEGGSGSPAKPRRLQAMHLKTKIYPSAYIYIYVYTYLYMCLFVLLYFIVYVCKPKLVE